MNGEIEIIRAKATNEGVPDRRSMQGKPADYTLNCSLCDAETVRIGMQGDGLIISSPLRSYGIRVPDLKKYITAIENNQLGQVHQLLSELGFDGLDFYCPECDKVFCDEHYKLDPVWDKGFYDYTEGTCPEDHRRVVDD